MSLEDNDNKKSSIDNYYDELGLIDLNYNGDGQKKDESSSAQTDISNSAPNKRNSSGSFLKNSHLFSGRVNRRTVGTALFSIAILLGVFSLGFIFSPTLALINMKEALSNDLNDSMIVYDRFSKAIMAKQIGSGCSDDSSKIACKFSTMSSMTKKFYEANGFFIPSADEVYFRSKNGSDYENYVRYSVPAVFLPGISTSAKQLAWKAFSNPGGIGDNLNQTLQNGLKNSKVIVGSSGGGLAGISGNRVLTLGQIFDKDSNLRDLIYNIHDPRYGVFQDRFFPHMLWTKYGIKQTSELRGESESDIAQLFDRLVRRMHYGGGGDLEDSRNFFNQKGSNTDGTGIYSLGFLDDAPTKYYIEPMYAGVVKDVRTHQDLMCKLYSFGILSENVAMKARLTSQARFAMQYLAAADAAKAGASINNDAVINFLMSRLANESPSGSGKSGYDTATYRVASKVDSIDKYVKGYNKDDKDFNMDGLSSSSDFLTIIRGGALGKIVDKIDGKGGVLDKTEVNVGNLDIKKIKNANVSGSVTMDLNMGGGAINIPMGAVVFDLLGATQYLRARMSDDLKKRIGTVSTHSSKKGVSLINARDYDLKSRDACLDSYSSDQADAERKGNSKVSAIDRQSLLDYIDALHLPHGGSSVQNPICYQNVGFPAVGSVDVFSRILYEFVMMRLPGLIEKASPELGELLKVIWSCDVLAANSSVFANVSKFFIDLTMIPIFVKSNYPNIFSKEAPKFDSGIKGVKAQDNIFAGAGNIFGDVSQSLGMRPASIESYAKYIMSDKKFGSYGNAISKARENPFDITNQYSFLGMSLAGLFPDTYESGSQSITPKVSLPFMYKSALVSAGNMITGDAAKAFSSIDDKVKTVENSVRNVTNGVIDPVKVIDQVNYMKRLASFDPKGGASKQCGFYTGVVKDPHKKYPNYDKKDSIEPDFGCNIRWSMNPKVLDMASDLDGVIKYMTETKNGAKDKSHLNRDRGEDASGVTSVADEESKYDEDKTFVNKDTGEPNMKTDYGRFIQFCVNRSAPWLSSDYPRGIGVALAGEPTLPEFPKDERKVDNPKLFAFSNYNYIRRDDNDTSQKIPAVQWGGKDDVDWINGKNCLKEDDVKINNFRAYTAACRVLASMSGGYQCWTVDADPSFTSTYSSRNGIIFQGEN